MASNRTFLTFLNTTIHNWFKDKEVIKELYKLTLGAFVPLSEKGVADGVATLGSDGYVPLTQVNPIVIEKIYAYSGVHTLPEQLGLTTTDVQNGDLIELHSTTTNTTIMYAVVDDTKLNLSAGFAVFSAGTSVNFTGSLTGDVSGTQSATSVNKINGTSLAGLSTGLLKNTTTTGVPSIAVAGTDYIVGNQGAQYYTPYFSALGTLAASSTTVTDGLSLGIGGIAYSDFPNASGTKVKFVVGDTTNLSPRGIMSWQSSGDTNGARFHLRKSNGTFASPSTIVNDGLLAVSVSATGTNYNLGDIITLNGGTGGQVIVTRLSGSSVAAVNIYAAGTGYTTGTASQSSVSPSGGTGCTILVNEVGSSLGRIVASGRDSSSFVETANIQMASTGTISSGKIPSTMSFFTTDANGYYNETLKLSSDRAIKLPYNAGAITPAGTTGYITMWSGSLGTLNFRKGTGAIAGLSFPTGGDQTYSFPNVGIDSTLAILGAQTFTAQQTMPSAVISGTGGNGYLQLANQTSAPSGASSSTTIYADTNGKLSWKNGVSSFTRTFDASGLDISTTWALPTKTLVGTLTLAGLETAQTFTAAQTFSTGITVSSGTSTFPSGASISSGGSITSGGNINMLSNGTFAMTGSFVMSSPTNGKITFMNGSSNDFGLIQFGGTTSTYPAFLTQYTISAQSITSFSTSGGTITTPSAHNLRVGDVVTFTATSGLPSELTANSDYYVASVGSTITFTVASSLGGSTITYASNTPTAPTFSRARAILCRSGEATTFASMARSSFYSGNHSINGTWTANSSSAQLLINGGATTTNGFSANGTGLGINAANGFSGNLIDAQVNGVRAAKISNSGLLNLGSNVSNYITPYDGGGSAIGGAALQYSSGANSNGYSSHYFIGQTRTNTSGNIGFIDISNSFGASSGSANYRPLSLAYTINNSGAVSGTATGIYLNATETALNGMTHNLMDLQVGGVSKFSVSNLGKAIIGNNNLGSLLGSLYIANASISSSTSFGTLGFGIAQGACTYTSTTSSGTIAITGVNTFAQPTLQPPSNTNITLTDVATIYIADAPTFTSNGIGTITNSHSYSLLVNNGASCFKGGLSTGLAASSSNAYLTADASINSTGNSHAQLVSGAGNTAFRILLGASSTSSGSVSTGYYYANTMINASPINLATAGTTVPFAASLGVRPITGINYGTVTNSASIYIDGASTVATTNYALYVNSGNSYFGGKQIYDSTYINAGTTGDQTINKPSGSVNIAAGGSTIRVTNSFVTTNSIVLAVVMTNDATAILKNVTVSSGQFTINLTAAATAETKIGFIVNN